MFEGGSSGGFGNFSGVGSCAASPAGCAGEGFGDVDFFVPCAVEEFGDNLCFIVAKRDGLEFRSSRAVTRFCKSFTRASRSLKRVFTVVKASPLARNLGDPFRIVSGRDPRRLFACDPRVRFDGRRDIVDPTLIFFFRCTSTRVAGHRGKAISAGGHGGADFKKMVSHWYRYIVFMTVLDLRVTKVQVYQSRWRFFLLTVISLIRHLVKY